MSEVGNVSGHEKPPRTRHARGRVSPCNRARATNRPRDMLVSPNTAIGRRLNDLAEEFAALKGGWDNLSPLDAYHLRRCAHLGAACEALRTRSLTDSKTDLLQLVRMEGQFSRALREAGLSGTPEPQADEPDLDEYLGQDDATEGEDDDARD